MTVNRIKYRSGYKYQLAEDYAEQIGIFPPAPISTDWFSFDMTGRLWVKCGYAWDGPSGFITIHTRDSMRGSLEHDVGYQMIREYFLPPEYRKPFDKRLRAVIIEDGMDPKRAKTWYDIVRLFGSRAARPGSDGGKPLCTAP